MIVVLRLLRPYYSTGGYHCMAKVIKAARPFHQTLPAISHYTKSSKDQIFTSSVQTDTVRHYSYTAAHRQPVTTWSSG